MKLPNPDIPPEAQDEDTLHTMIVWDEARGESPEGRAAVAHVALNRAKRKHTSLAAALLKRWAFSGLWPESNPHREMMLNPLKYDKKSIWEACWNAAAEARQGLSSDPTNGAVVYCTRALWMRPAAAPKAKWFELPEIASGRTKKLAVVGSHVFADTAI